MSDSSTNYERAQTEVQLLNVSTKNCTYSNSILNAFCLAPWNLKTRHRRMLETCFLPFLLDFFVWMLQTLWVYIVSFLSTMNCCILQWTVAFYKHSLKKKHFFLMVFNFSIKFDYIPLSVMITGLWQHKKRPGNLSAALKLKHKLLWPTIGLDISSQVMSKQVHPSFD